MDSTSTDGEMSTSGECSSRPGCSKQQIPDIADKNSENTSPFKPESVEVKYDFLYKIICSAVISPNTFFVRLAEYDNKLSLLNEEINEYVSTYTAERKNDQYGIGDYCLAKYSDDEYYRTRIYRFDTDESGNKLYCCYFVDFGDLYNVEPEFIYPITNDQIVQLPFQALECKLFGIEPINGGDWTGDFDKPFSDFCYETEDCEYSKKLLYIKLMAFEDSDYFEGKKFSIFLYDCSVANIVSVLNHHLVQKDLAAYKSQQKSILFDDNKYLESYEIQQYVSKYSERHVLFMYDNLSEEYHEALKEFEKLNIVDFDTDDSTTDDEWDVCFDLEMYVETKKKLSPEAPPDIFDHLHAQMKKSKKKKKK